jgi:hypothetical protein
LEVSSGQIVLETLSLKRKKKAGGVTQAVRNKEYLPRKLEALSSNSRVTKKKNQNRLMTGFIQIDLYSTKQSLRPINNTSGVRWT